jgi:Sulfotransferase family
MISKEKKFIFIHNFKTGGTSIEKKLGLFDVLERDVQDHRTIREIELLTQRGHFFRKSLYALKIGKPKASVHNFKTALFPELTKTQYNEFYKFSFVRNTWSRLYSWYANMMKDDVLRLAFGIKDRGFTYEEFLNEKIDHSTFSQLYFLTDSTGKVPMDFVGRFENLQEDFNTVCSHLGIDDPALPKLLVRNYGQYTDGYTAKTKDLVHQLYQEEIAYFGFEYGE